MPLKYIGKETCTAKNTTVYANFNNLSNQKVFEVSSILLNLPFHGEYYISFIYCIKQIWVMKVLCCSKICIYNPKQQAVKKPVALKKAIV